MLHRQHLRRLARSTATLRAGVLALCCVAIPTAAALAQQADTAATIATGIRVYKEQGECWRCHGWNGTGGLPNVGDVADAPDPGPALTTSRMDRQAMLEMVSCGRPEGKMPPFAPGAWTPQRRCYGKVAADLAPGERPPVAQVTLTQGQIEAVVTYVLSVYQGKSMTRAYCLQYFGVAQTPVCDPFP